MLIDKIKTSTSQLILMAIFAVILMSIVPVIIKWVNVNPATIGIVRLSIAVLGIGIFVIASKSALSLSRKDLMWLALLGLVFALHWYSYFVSIKKADASLAAIGVATFGIHLLLLSSFINSEKFRATDILAIVISIAGIYLASPKVNLQQDKLQGFLLAITSGFLYALLPIINQRINHIPTKIRALGQFGFALLAFLLLLPQANFNISLNDWKGLIVLGLLSTLIAHTLWIKVSTELPSSLTAVIYYSYVPMAMLLSFFLLNESMSWHKITGAGLIIFANIMVIMQHNSTSISAEKN
jgi:drug/metabolite transporter (DMT)-like permease